MTMVWTITIWVCFGLLAFRSREGPGDLLQRISIYLYKKISTSKILKKYVQAQDRQILKSLLCLHPGDPPVQLLTEYYTGKIRIVLLVLLVGTMLACCSELAGEGADIMVSRGTVSRGEETRTIVLEAKVKGEGETIREEIPLEVKERELQLQEAETLYREFVGQLDGLILGENASIQEIREDLYLPEEVEGYPFWVRWISGDTLLLGNDGGVHAETLEEAAEVTLRAEILYGELEWQYSWKLTLQPPLRTEREQLIYELKKRSNAAAGEQPYAQSFALPQTIEGREVSWSQKKESSGSSILLLTLAAAVGVYCLKDKDLQEELVKRRLQIKREYPDMVSKYALFLGAGMTVRGAFQKICKDYYNKVLDAPGEEKNGWGMGPFGKFLEKRSREKKLRIHPLYEEMLYSCNELRAGVSESRVYENFGRRTGVQEYTRLCTLLNQNLKKGNSTLVQRLREEWEEALQEGTHMQKRQGEEAGTKLLAPMVMMLLMVLLMIMLPAFSGLGI